MTANNQWFTVDLLQEYKAATGASSAGITIMRTHLFINPRSPSIGDTWWLGIKVDDLDQITGPTTNALVVNPHDNPYTRWAFSRKFINDSNLNTGFGPSAWNGCNLDLRAKRRMEEVQEVYMAVLYQDTVTTVAKSYDLFARTLIALP